MSHVQDPSAAIPATPYPLRLEADLEPQLSRWLWLVKWLLLIPHVVVLVLLWIGYLLLSVAALVAIVVTGRYPRGIFDVTVGILRWTWRVGYYGYSALGTDRYPPFSLGEHPDYPARLTVEYPGELSRGLALVKFWLLAIPQYLVVSVIGGGGWGHLGLTSVLVLIAAFALAFTGTYPRAIFDLVIGLERWSFRVVGYVSLMTDVYPPFRLDQGGHEPVPAS